jgi:predicted phosphoribosyltransferase
MFQDRADAGRQLAQNLARYRGKDAVVLALPRGGVVTGHAIAKALGLPLDIVVARKIGHPHNPEYAICAVDEKGTLLCNEQERAMVGAEWLAQEVERERQEAERRIKTYRSGNGPAPVAGKVAILVDDGVATGLTMRLAIVAVRAQKPARVVVAVPVAPPDVALEIKKEADELVLLEPPQEFRGAVGAHYENFSQVEDTEVIKLISEI